jgi:phage terminase large subunit-like protein
MGVLMVPVDRDAWPSLGGQVCDWIEDHLVFGPGDLVGQPARIDDEKRALLWRMYEVYPRTHANAGRRRFKRAALSMRKGTAKTEFAAWVAACELHHDSPVRCVDWDGETPIGGPVTDPYIPMVAYTEEQTEDLAYGALRVILEKSQVASDFDIGLERILRKVGYGKAVALATAPDARDGARTTFQHFDETHRFTLDRLGRAHKSMLANIPKRRLADAWSLETTTAPEPGTGSVAEATMDYARAVAAGSITDTKLFFFHREASEAHDLSTVAGIRAAVMEASGPVAEWSDIDGIVEQWQDPTSDKTYLERVWLNRLVQSSSQAFDVETFRSLAKAESPAQRADVITIGFDGSLFHDATGVVATHVATGYQWLAGVWECPPTQETWRVPTDDVDAVIDDLFSRFMVWRMYADPSYWGSQVATWQGKYGDKRVVEWVTNSRRKMAAALESYDTAIKDKRLSHDGSKAFLRHVANARRENLLQRDEQGKPLWLIRKERNNSPHKIDVAMAAVLSWEARNDAVASGVLKAPASVLAEWV